MEHLKNNQWAGESVVIVGGGPSLADFDWSHLKCGKRIIVINRAVFDVPWADVFITEDWRFITRFAARDEWKNFKGVKLFACPDPAYVADVWGVAPEVRIMHSRPKKDGWSKRLEDGLFTSSNSAIPALNLADILGANPIYLLGFDCKRGPAKEMNYHADYPQEWAVGTHQLESFASDFKYAAAVNLKHREIINLNPDSAIDCWPKIPRESILGPARTWMGR